MPAACANCLCKAAAVKQRREIFKGENHEPYNVIRTKTNRFCCAVPLPRRQRRRSRRSAGRNPGRSSGCSESGCSNAARSGAKPEASSGASHAAGSGAGPDARANVKPIASSKVTPNANPSASAGRRARLRLGRRRRMAERRPGPDAAAAVDAVHAMDGAGAGHDAAMGWICGSVCAAANDASLEPGCAVVGAEHAKLG